MNLSHLPEPIRKTASAILARMAADDASHPETVHYSYQGGDRSGTRVDAFKAILAAIPGPYEAAGTLAGRESLLSVVGLA